MQHIADALVSAALAELAQHHHTQIDLLTGQAGQGDPDVKDEIAYHLRDYRAFLKAADAWARGVRPVLTERGVYLVPSRSQGGTVHAVSRDGGFWRCGPTCAATAFHWHTALLLGIERAEELAELQDDGDAAAPTAAPDDDAACADSYEAAVRSLRDRIVACRARYLVAA